LDHKTEFDITHRFNEEQVQIHGMAHPMDAFVPVSSGRGFAMGAYHTKGLPLADSLMDSNKHWVLLDNFFHSAYGGSFINHIYLIAADAAVDTAAPPDYQISLGYHGMPIRKTLVYGAKHWVVNTAFTRQGPLVPKRVWNENYFVPPQKMQTIGDLLGDAHHT